MKNEERKDQTGESKTKLLTGGEERPSDPLAHVYYNALTEGVNAVLL